MGQNTVTTAVAQNYQVSAGKSILSLAHSGDGSSADAVVSVNTPRSGNTGGIFSSEAVEVAPPSSVFVREPDDTGLLESVESGDIATDEDYGYFWRLCVDWLRIGFFYSEWRHKVVEYLRGERDRLVEQKAAGFRERVTVEIAGIEFELRAGGGRHYGVVLIADGVEVRLCRRYPSIPEVQVEFTGRWFYDHTLYQTVHVAREIADFFGTPDRDLISRLDLRVDVPVELRERHFSQFRGHGKRCLGFQRDGRTGRAGVIGTGRSQWRDFTVRVYNKRLEAGNGAWLSYVRSFGVPDDVPVTRIEVEFERGELRKFGLECAADLHRSDLLRLAWRRVVHKYLYLVPLEDVEVRERSRVVVVDWWRRIQELGISQGVVVRDFQAADVTTHRLRVGVGCLAGEMVESGFSEVVSDSEAVANAMVDLVDVEIERQAREMAEYVCRRLVPVLADAIVRKSQDRLRLLAATIQAAGLQYMSRKRRARRLWYVPNHRLN